MYVWTLVDSNSFKSWAWFNALGCILLLRITPMFFNTYGLGLMVYIVSPTANPEVWRGWE